MKFKENSLLSFTNTSQGKLLGQPGTQLIPRKEALSSHTVRYQHITYTGR